jgi:hypothetical protein
MITDSGSEQLVTALQQSVKDVITFTLGRNGLMGGIKLELDDENFDLQPAGKGDRHFKSFLLPPPFFFSFFLSFFLSFSLMHTHSFT